MTSITDGQRGTNLRLDKDRFSLCHTAPLHVELFNELICVELSLPVALIAITAIHRSIRTRFKGNRSLGTAASTNRRVHFPVFTATTATLSPVLPSPGRPASRTPARLVLVPFRRKEVLLTCGKIEFSSTVPAHQSLILVHRKPPNHEALRGP